MCLADEPAVRGTPHAPAVSRFAMTIHRRLSTLLLVQMFAAVAACTEDTPTRPTPSFAASTVQVRENVEIPVDDVFSCGTFEIHVVGSLEDRARLVFDEAGNLLQRHGLLLVRTTVTNLTTGESLEDNASTPFSVDFTTGVVINNGRVADIRNGVRVRDIGRLVWDLETGEILFEAGPHDIGLNPREPSLCQALA
jgi:hypothetical protein